MSTPVVPAHSVARRWMIALSALLVVAQLADTVWPRADAREGSPASVVLVVALTLLLALYPNGRSVPRWMIWVAIAAIALFGASALVGPDVAVRFLWPLPLAPLLLLLAIGGQGYRYWRRSDAAEREAVRWPLLGLLLVLTVVVPADLIAVAITGATITDPAPFATAMLQLGMLLPGLGFLAGLLAPRTELVDRLLALWLASVLSAAALGAVFAATFSVSGLWLAEPWPAWIGAGAVAAASIPVVPFTRRIGQRVVFRGRAAPEQAVADLARRLRATLDLADVPAEVASAVVAATGARSAILRRSGQQSPWAVSGEPDESEKWETTIEHLGLPVATLAVQPRSGESALASADRVVIEALATAAAPALHGARLASAFPELTDRERQVLAGIVRGLPNTAIAARLGVSAKTVANYVSIVLTKLRVPDKERAAELARRRSAEFG